MPRENYKGRSLYIGRSGNYSTEVFQVCHKCGTPVFNEDVSTHIEWHDKMDELIDWAQSVSKLFEVKTEEEIDEEATKEIDEEATKELKRNLLRPNEGLWF